jgi:protoporphyrinogen oxidase
MPDAAEPSPQDHQIVIIGAGPAGLTAAYQLGKLGIGSTVLEADSVVGGISRTVERNGWRFDIGGHRFFTKVQAVESLWHEILADDDFLLRPRMSRIYYEGKFFDYPLRASNALRNLGPFEALRCVLSYLWARIRPPRDQSTFEGWTVARFGWRLYRIFFKTYTEKVWGVPANQLQADWAAQRIKNLSLANAILHSLLPRRGQTEITSLIEAFQYPRLGPGMMWDRCAELAADGGAKIVLESPLTRIHHHDGRAVSIEHSSADGTTNELPVTDVISSMPLPQLLLAMEPPVPDDVRRAAERIRHRDFLTIALVVPESDGFPDNWIYVHETGVRLGRIQNFGSWSPDMVKEGRTCLGLEYFVNEGDDLWSMDDADLIALGTRELATIGLVEPEHVQTGYVVRMPKAYPTYDEEYHEAVGVMRGWLAACAPNVHPVGRNGMHRYNNQDHSMYTAMLTVENIVNDADHDIWAVNVEDDYHEEVRGATPAAGTGRDAPLLPRRAS